MIVYKETLLAYMLASRVNKLPKYIKPAHIEVFLKDFDLQQSEGTGSQVFISASDKKRHNYAKFVESPNNQNILHLTETALPEQVRFLFTSAKPALFNSGASISFEDACSMALKLHAERISQIGKDSALIWRHQDTDPKAYPKSYSSHYTDPALNNNIIDLIIGAHTAKKSGKRFAVYEYSYSGWGILQALDRLPPEVQKYIHFICHAPAQNQDLRFWEILDRTQARIDVMVVNPDFLPASQQFHNNIPGHVLDMSGNTPVSSVSNALVNYYFMDKAIPMINQIEKSVLCESGMDIN